MRRRKVWLHACRVVPLDDGGRLMDGEMVLLRCGMKWESDKVRVRRARGCVGWRKLKLRWCRMILVPCSGCLGGGRKRLGRPN